MAAACGENVGCWILRIPPARRAYLLWPRSRMPISSEKAMLEHAQKSAAGFGELFDAYYDRIYAYAYRRVGIRMVAEDIAAGVFEDALRGIRRLRWQGKPVIAWLYRIAGRRVVDYYRSTREVVEFAGDGLGAAEDGQG